MGGESLESRLREIELIRGRCHASDGRLDSSARWNRDHGGSRCRSGALGDLRCQDVKMSIELRVEYGEIMGQVSMESTP